LTGDDRNAAQLGSKLELGRYSQVAGIKIDVFGDQVFGVPACRARANSTNSARYDPLNNGIAKSLNNQCAE
jgi:hypothetical protein